MSVEIVMPKMGYDMTQGTLIRWLKREGDLVAVGDVIAEIETDKATVELESKAGGAVLKLLVDEGATVPVGSLITYAGRRRPVLGGGWAEQGLAARPQAGPRAGRGPHADRGHRPRRQNHPR